MPPAVIDRTKTCPFLIQVFYKVGDYHSLDVFTSPSNLPTADEVVVYAWPDTTLREIADILRDAVEEAKPKNAKQGLRMVYTDKHGNPASLELGIISSTTRGYMDSLTLSSIKFQTGDYLDIAIYL